MRRVAFDSGVGSRLIRILVTTALLLAGGTAVIPAAVNAEPPLPADDPFYAYDQPLANTTPGTVLRSRPAPFAFPKLSTPITSTQVLYRTTTQQNKPTAAVTTVLRPLVPGPTRLLSYHMAYDALGSQCNPSYTLTGRTDSPGAVLEQAVVAGYLAAGYTVVVPDYEGLDLEWTVGRQSGYAALDGIRAAEQILGLPASTPVAMTGYSGGSVATEWAAETAPHYAPELALIGAAAGGLPVHLAHNLPYVSGSANWAGVIPAMVVSFRRAYGLDTAAFLSARGAELTDAVENLCLGQFAKRYPGLTDAEMVRAPYRSLLDVPAAAAAVNDSIMGTAGTPAVPLLLAVGQSDPIGDSVMVARDIEALAHRYCGRGVPVTYARYQHHDHIAAFARFQADAAQFLTGRFAGTPPTTNCAAIGRGNSLAPVPTPAG
ncbi:lipase family protein [Nocardia flavorosea]|uniref:Lipase n=1 Tax=Nocardia flavorosea TaxID=53429 RepID=A0A846YFX3_9NOCA|nr:lipase family protein [Nocardia flavorosea]NKY56048.1 lipase [Nocardia flavorosea]